mgnify:CR=1 FL=1
MFLWSEKAFCSLSIEKIIFLITELSNLFYQSWPKKEICLPGDAKNTSPLIMTGKRYVDQEKILGISQEVKIKKDQTIFFRPVKVDCLLPISVSID